MKVSCWEKYHVLVRHTETKRHFSQLFLVCLGNLSSNCPFFSHLTVLRQIKASVGNVTHICFSTILFYQEGLLGATYERYLRWKFFIFLAQSFSSMYFGAYYDWLHFSLVSITLSNYSDCLIKDSGLLLKEQSFTNRQYFSFAKAIKLVVCWFSAKIKLF